jgi:hypothetical protein
MKIQWSTETKKLNWHEFKEYCKNLREDGHSDWRMPTIDELINSVDILNSEYEYWSATSFPNYTSSALSVDFSDGYVDYYYKTNTYYVRAVRTVRD